MLQSIIGGLLIFFALFNKDVKPGDKYDHLYKLYGAEFDVDWQILKAIAFAESGQTANAVNEKDPSYGLMQVLCSGNGEFCSNRFNIKGWPAKRSDLLDPEKNIFYAAQIIAWNIKTYGIEKGIAVYNRWDSRNETAPFSNQGYVDRVMAFYEGVKDGYFA